MPKMLLIGASIFGAGVFLVLILLVANGGANKMRQFAVLGDLLAGRHGGLNRVLLIGALFAIGIGALTSFGAVGGSGANLRKKCQETCTERGFKKATLGLSNDRDSQGRPLKVCKCSEGSDKDLEIKQSDLSQ